MLGSAFSTSASQLEQSAATTAGHREVAHTRSCSRASTSSCAARSDWACREASRQAALSSAKAAEVASEPEGDGPRNQGPRHGDSWVTSQALRLVVAEAGRIEDVRRVAVGRRWLRRRRLRRRGRWASWHRSTAQASQSKLARPPGVTGTPTRTPRAQAGTAGAAAGTTDGAALAAAVSTRAGAAAPPCAGPSPPRPRAPRAPPRRRLPRGPCAPSSFPRTSATSPPSGRPWAIEADCGSGRRRHVEVVGRSRRQDRPGEPAFCSVPSTRSTEPRACLEPKSCSAMASSPTVWKRLVAVLLQTRRDDLLEPVGASARDARSDGGGSMRDLDGQLGHRLGVEGGPPRQQLVQDDAERPDVGPRVDRLRDCSCSGDM